HATLGGESSRRVTGGEEAALGVREWRLALEEREARGTSRRRRRPSRPSTDATPNMKALPRGWTEHSWHRLRGLAPRSARPGLRRTRTMLLASSRLSCQGPRDD